MNDAQPNSTDLIRHRKYTRCVLCNKRDASNGDLIWIWQLDESKQMCSLAQIPTKWWTCDKCDPAKNKEADGE